MNFQEIRCLARRAADGKRDGGGGGRFDRNLNIRNGSSGTEGGRSGTAANIRSDEGRRHRADYLARRHLTVGRHVNSQIESLIEVDTRQTRRRAKHHREETVRHRRRLRLRPNG